MMRGSTFLLGLLSFDRRNIGKIPLFISLSPLSLSLSDSFSLSCLLPLFFSFSFLIPPNSTLMFVPLSFSHFSFSFFFFFLFFLFLLSFPSFYHFSSLIWIASIGWSKSWGNFPPLSSITLVITMFFFLIFFISFFPFITSCNTWLNVSHLSQVHHMAHAMCHSPRVPYGIHMIMLCVTRHRCLKKREILHVSKFDEIRQGNKIS